MAPAASPAAGCRRGGPISTTSSPWELGGPTNLSNALSLCAAHHARLHDGHYRILGSPDEELHFETRDGRPIVPPPARIDPGQGGGTAHLRRLARERGHQIGGMTPMALDGGQPPDYGLAQVAGVDQHLDGQARAGPSPP